MKYKAIIFDLDGTLLDTLRDLTDSVNKSLRHFGFPPHSREVFKYFIGDGRDTMVRRALPPEHRDDTTLNRVVKYVDKEYDKHWADNTRPYDGIPELLDALILNNYKIAVLSNKPHSFTETMVAKLLSRWHFEAIAGALPSVPIKPDPTSALKIAQELNIKPVDFLYLGDSDIDMKTATRAKMFPVGALWGFRTAEELKAGGAKALIKHPKELLTLL